MSEVSKFRSEDALSPSPVLEDATARQSGAADSRRGKLQITRALLLVVVPLLIVAGAVFAYLQAGRYVSTDNAYVKAHIVNIAAEVSGSIAQVQVEENDRVSAGMTLLKLREATFRIAFERAQAMLSQVESEVAADRQAYRQALAEIDLHQATAEFARAQFARQEGLRSASLGTVEALDTARYALDSALQQIEVAQQEAATLLARLHGSAEAPVAEHPRYRQALAELQQAGLDLERTDVRAPFSGMVTMRPEPGDYVELGQPIMAIVADEGMWIEANFKETQLTFIQPGQQAEIEIDTYPGRRWRGKVQSISEATGAEFALLPPQNATGNWVKVVQRIPVRIAIESQQGMPALRAGMSSTVTVDTRHQRTWRDLLPGR
jgi:membrane fusion protein (multidrug efflux system)